MPPVSMTRLMAKREMYTKLVLKFRRHGGFGTVSDHITEQVKAPRIGDDAIYLLEAAVLSATGHSM